MEYGLIGQKLGHSFSPAIHRKLGGYPYQLRELEPEELGPFLEAGEFRGLNVTIPYKTAVIPYCRELTGPAKKTGSVNTLLRRPDGSLLGHNTDYEGFSYMVRSAERLCGTPVIPDSKVLVLGTGGASLTVRAALRDLGAGELVSISRSGEDNYENLDRHADAQVIVNATPVGMYPNTGVSPVKLEGFPQLRAVFDLIYNPSKTQLLLDAERLGAVWANGLSMLAAQAKGAAELFLGKRIPDERVEEICREIERDTKNLILVGMPGCGKTTVGNILARRLGRELADTDALVEERAGCSIPDLFAQQGEETFRQLEHQALCQVSKQSGLVISTGGGILTRSENLDPLRQNSVVIYLERDLNQLPTAGRPISQGRDIRQLFAERHAGYCRASDLRVQNTTPEEAAEEIIRRCAP